MKKQIKPILVAVVGIIAISMLVGCASGPKKEKGPKAPVFGAPTEIQDAINQIAAQLPIPVPGGSLVISLEGDAWRAKKDGKDFLAGDCIVEETDTGMILTLNQSWLWVDTGQINPLNNQPLASWVKTPGPEIVLEYTKGPPASLKKISKDPDEAAE